MTEGAVAGRTPGHEVESRSFTALGSRCELFAVDAPAGSLAEAEAWIHEMHARLTRFEHTSELSRFNAQSGMWTAVSEELEALLRAALEAWWISDGLVHAAILPALRASGYGRDLAAGPTAIGKPLGPLPPLTELLGVRPGTAWLRAGAAVDVGGIAKGWLADRLVARIGPNSLANLGGDLVARGGGPDGDGWPVGFGGETVLLADRAAATSGRSKRQWQSGLHHLIDPRTGWPAATDLEEVAVLAPSGFLAEVYAKTAFLLGRTAGAAWLASRSPGWAFT